MSYENVENELVQLYKESIDLQGEEYRRKLNEMAVILKAKEEQQYKHLADLIHSDEDSMQKPTSLLDKVIAKYAADAYMYFLGGNSEELFHKELGLVTLKIRSIQLLIIQGQYLDNSNGIIKAIKSLNSECRSARRIMKLTKKQAILNTVLCIGSLALAGVFVGIACSIMLPAPLFMLLSSAFALFGILAFYLSMCVVNKIPTIFNKSPQVLRDAKDIIRISNKEAKVIANRPVL